MDILDGFGGLVGFCLKQNDWFCFNTPHQHELFLSFCWTIAVPKPLAHIHWRCHLQGVSRVQWGILQYICIMLYYNILYFLIYHNILYYVLCYVMLYYIMLYYILLYYIILYNIILYYIILYYIILYYIVSYFIILYFIFFIILF